MYRKRCAEDPGQPEYTLCGMAFDSPYTEPDVEEFNLAAPGQHVTCDQCRRSIREIISEYTPTGLRRRHPTAD